MSDKVFDYEQFFDDQIGALHAVNRYRVFANLKRQKGNFPIADHFTQQSFEKSEDDLDVDSSQDQVTVWCSNDYLGMGQHDKVIAAMHTVLDECGAGAGGTRNIAGTNSYHIQLEEELASFHHKEKALLFTSGYVANVTTLKTLGEILPDAIFLSDSMNHNSMIEGVRASKCEKQIFKHNDAGDLEKRLKKIGSNRPKIILFESVYSMDGDIAPLAELLDVVERYNGLSFLDEVHAVGLYGHNGSGVAERDQLADRVDIIQGTLAKAAGVVGGYIASSAKVIDVIRSYGHGFIFTTALPPVIAAGALQSIKILGSDEGRELRQRQQNNVKIIEARLTEKKIPVMENPSHIIPVFIGNAKLCKQASDYLMARHKIYIQPINYPTVAQGTERLRITPSPHHNEDHINHLVASLEETWLELKLPREIIL